MKNRRPSKKKTITGLVALGFVALLGAALFWHFRTSTNCVEVSGPMIRPVKTIYLSEESTNETRSFPGLVKAASDTKLAFRVGGPLIQFDVHIGQRVVKGDVIARIDPRDFEINVIRLTATLDEARANLKAMRVGARVEDIALLEADLKAAKARLTEAKNSHTRYQTLSAGKIVSQSEYDHVNAAFETAKAQVEATAQKLKKARSGARKEDIEAAQARIRCLSADLKAAKHALSDTTLTAPFTGYVDRKYVENHENVKERDPILSLLDFSNAEVHTAIPEDLVVRRSHFTHVTCTLDTYPNRCFEATIKEVGHKTDSANQSYPMTVILHIPEDIVVKSGMAAMVSVSLKSPGQRDTGFILPTGAVFADAEGYSCVWRIDPRTMRVIKRRVTTGTLRGNAIQVLSGLKAGDRVVTAGAKFLRDGQEVRILHKEREEHS